MKYPLYKKHKGSFYKIESENKTICITVFPFGDMMASTYRATVTIVGFMDYEDATANEWLENLRKFHTAHMEFMEKELTPIKTQSTFIPTRLQATGQPSISKKAERTLANADL